jgi:internalin A
MSEKTRDQVFISYSRSDKRWRDDLHMMLAPLLREKLLKIWDDTYITPGTKWYDAITDAISSAKAAVFLVSSDFLNSDFIIKNELNPVLEAAEKKHITVLWFTIDHCLYQHTRLEQYQAVNDPAKPLNSFSGSKRTKELTRICKEIIKHI